MCRIGGQRDGAARASILAESERTVIYGGGNIVSAMLMLLPLHTLCFHTIVRGGFGLLKSYDLNRHNLIPFSDLCCSSRFTHQRWMLRMSPTTFCSPYVTNHIFAIIGWHQKLLQCCQILSLELSTLYGFNDSFKPNTFVNNPK